ncbi:MAG: hypothetical protein KTV68_17330 [Acidimicrobiia bacterium]|nr:hypothetical protein [Acidimicrobiia bacterium]
MQQSPDKSSRTFDPSEDIRHPAAGIGQFQSIPVPDNSSTQFRNKFTWMAYVADEPIEYDIFDNRAQNALKRNNYLTWGDLGRSSYEALYRIQGVGDLTVDRINEALEHYKPSTSKHTRIDDPFLESKDETTAILPDPKTYIAIEWARALTDDNTLGGLLQAHLSGIDMPQEVVNALEIILDTPIPTFSGHHVPLLGDQIDELIAEAGDPELFVARECSRLRPTLEELGDSRSLTRERIRQIVARDAEHIRVALASEQFQTVRWGADRLSTEFGLVIPIEHYAVEQWKTRLGNRRFEILRWVAGYVHKDHLLQKSANARSELLELICDAIGNGWLVNIEDILCDREIPVLPDVAQNIMLDSGGWRNIGDGWLLKWDGTIHDKAERILRLTCKPMTPAELVEAIGHGSARSLKNRRGSNLMRVDMAFRLAPKDWGLEEYEGIITEITQRIERGGGVASKAAIIEEFTNNFGNSVTSIIMNLGLPIFNVVGDSVRFADSFSFDPMPPSTVAGAVQTTEGWGERQTVTQDHMRGYSFGVSPHIAWANGLRPSDSLVVRVNGSSLHEASVIWRVTNLNGKVDVGRLRMWLEERQIGPGASLLLCPTPTGVAAHVGEEEIQAARPVAPPIAPDIAAMMEDL